MSFPGFDNGGRWPLVVDELLSFNEVDDDDADATGAECFGFFRRRTSDAMVASCLDSNQCNPENDDSIHGIRQNLIHDECFEYKTNP